MITTCVFDAYGTLFDVAAAARLAASEPNRDDLAEHWPKLAEIWRNKQLNYSWLRAITGDHIDFWTVTQNGLDYALEALGLDTDPKLRERLLHLYWELQAYDEVPAMLKELKDAGYTCAILSNGSSDMLNGAVKSAGLVSLLDAVLSVDSVGVFRPHSRVYDLVNAHFKTTSDQVLFVSSNGWDAAGAANYGFKTAWVNRANDPMDRLMATPDHILNDLTTIPQLARL